MSWGSLRLRIDKKNVSNVIEKISLQVQIRNFRVPILYSVCNDSDPLPSSPPPPSSWQIMPGP